MKRYAQYGKGLPEVNISGNAYTRPANTLRLGDSIVVLDTNIIPKRRDELLNEIRAEIEAESVSIPSTPKTKTPKQEVVSDES